MLDVVTSQKRDATFCPTTITIFVGYPTTLSRRGQWGRWCRSILSVNTPEGMGIWAHAPISSIDTSMARFFDQPCMAWCMKWCMVSCMTSCITTVFCIARCMAGAWRHASQVPEPFFAWRHAWGLVKQNYARHAWSHAWRPAKFQKYTDATIVVYTLWLSFSLSIVVRNIRHYSFQPVYQTNCHRREYSLFLFKNHEKNWKSEYSRRWQFVW